MNLQFYRDTLDHHGFGSALYHVAFRAAHRLTELEAWQALVVTPAMLSCCRSSWLMGSSTG